MGAWQHQGEQLGGNYGRKQQEIPRGSRKGEIVQAQLHIHRHRASRHGAPSMDSYQMDYQKHVACPQG